MTHLLTLEIAERIQEEIPELFKMLSAGVRVGSRIAVTPRSRSNLVSDMIEEGYAEEQGGSIFLHRDQIPALSAACKFIESDRQKQR